MMKKGYWQQIIVAATLVLLGGALVALADETVRIEVVKVSGEEVEVRLDETTEIIRLDDLTDGEERVIESGDHQVTVRRDGDQLRISLDGETIDLGDHTCLHKAASQLWIGSEERDEGDADLHKIVIIGANDGDHAAHTFIHAGDDEELDGQHLIELALGDNLQGLEPLLVRIGGDGSDRVRFRCDDDGSELVVDADKVTGDTYICPVTGCVMHRVSEPVARVIKVQRSCCKKADSGKTE